MDVRINATGRQNELFPRNHVRGRTDNHVGIDSLHHIGISRLANTHNAIPLDSDIGLDNARDRIDNQSVRNDHIQGLVGWNSRRLNEEEERKR
jgi:hypothetical protein